MRLGHLYPFTGPAWFPSFSISSAQLAVPTTGLAMVDPAQCPTSSLLLFPVGIVDLVLSLSHAAQQVGDQLLLPRKAVLSTGPVLSRR